MQNEKPKKITKTMPINIILELVPDSIKVLSDAGLQCASCSFNSLDTLENGMKLHGFSGADVNKMVHKLNGLYTAMTTETRKPTPADLKRELIEEGNKTYTKIAGMLFSSKTIAALEELSGGKPGLEIRIEAGGCSGYTNQYDFEEEPRDDETVFVLSDNLSLFMNDYTFDRLYDSVVTYEAGLHGSGLTFRNPNIKNECHCGKSFGF
jgi:iron-sulfur cluster assembly accessory protein